jgi:putative ABC transport system permease protein
MEPPVAGSKEPRELRASRDWKMEPADHTGLGGVRIWQLNLKSAVKSLLGNKMRSGLAMLGIIIGVGAVITMLAIGAGAQQQVMARFLAMGSSTLIIRPAQRGSGGVNTGTQQNLIIEDAEAVSRLEGVACVSPNVQSSVQLKYLNNNFKSDANGVSADYFTIHSFELQSGRNFSADESDSLKRLAILGPITASALFGDESPIGKTIQVNGINFEVIGVNKAKGSQGWTGPDDELFVPYRTAMRILFGLRNLRQIDVLVDEGHELSAVSGEPPGASPWGMRVGVVHETPPPLGSIAEVLRRRHRLQDQTADDFNIQNQAEVIAAAADSTLVFRMLLGAIASISLVVGGIGIMNIMLVTVTERTREIGTRKAIGAKNMDILAQFLLEALLLSGIGGLVGATAGIAGARIVPLIPMFDGFVTIVHLSYVVLSFCVAGLTGVVFGVFPAWRASRMDPIEALRCE